MKKREKFMPDTFKLGTKSSIKYPRLIWYRLTKSATNGTEIMSKS
jgi:hypothetical protein